MTYTDARRDAPGVMTGDPLIESDRVEGTSVYGSDGDHIGSIKRLMIEKISGKVTLRGDVIRRVPWHWRGRAHDSLEQARIRYGLGGYRTDITEDQLRGAPTFYRESDYRWSDRDRERELHDYWKTPYYWGI